MDIAAQYNNRALVPDHPAIIEGWHRDAAAYRAQVRAEIDLSYGARPRNRVDVFHPEHGDRGGPLVVFVHGGYWRSFDKSMFSHMAAGANSHGLVVAVPGYTLCPEVTIPDIIDELRQACLFIYRSFGRPLVVCGHSAGGHLAACMAATNWSQIGSSGDMVKAGLAVSGLFDLRPLMATPLNEDLRLTQADALAASPLMWPVPRSMRFPCWVGADESGEFHRQSRSL